MVSMKIISMYDISDITMTICLQTITNEREYGNLREVGEFTAYIDFVQNVHRICINVKVLHECTSLNALHLHM